MSGAWVYGPGYRAHLLRRAAQPPGVIRTRCGQEMITTPETVEHATAPDRACDMCQQVGMLDVIHRAVADMITGADPAPHLPPALREDLLVALADLAVRRPAGG